MKYLDTVRLIKNKSSYAKENVFMGMEGVIMISEIRYNTFCVIFTGKDGVDIADIAVDIEDLEVVSESNITFDRLKEIALPGFEIMVKDGFKINTYGKKTNKTAYDYKS